ncbi:MAG: KH domain-containing protein [Acidimicrobiales bacterium]
MLRSPDAKAMLQALAECWPEDADIERIVIAERGERRVAVTVWTSAPGLVVGHEGSVLAAMTARIGAAVPDHEVELQVMPGPLSATQENLLDDLREEILHDLREGEPPFAEAMAGSAPQGRDLVPDLVGMTVPGAHTKAQSSGFSLTTGDPDGVPITYSMAHGQYGEWTVIAQRPKPGVLAPLHSRIAVAIESRGGGNSGDREPRAPGPRGGIARLERVASTEERE